MPNHDELTLTGSLDWKEFRDLLVEKLKEASTDKEFLSILSSLDFATSQSEEEMQGKRRMLGIPET